jgi:hypothetical protein
LSLAFSYWTDKPWFHTKGKTCCYIHHTFLLGFPNWTVIYFIITVPSIAINGHVDAFGVVLPLGDYFWNSCLIMVAIGGGGVHQSCR